MSDTLLGVTGVSKRFGGFTALDRIDVAVRQGERFGLIGPNGSGKTTLINCICGTLRNDEGSIVFAGEDVTRLPAYLRTRRGVARSFQIPRPFRTMTVHENLMVAIDFAGSRRGAVVSHDAAEAMAILGKIGLAAKAATPASQLSQVELRKMELARALAARPKLLISDEAMAGLAGGEVDEVLDVLIALNREGITIIMIEHIMQAVMRFSERVMCLDAGRIICEGTPQQVMNDARVQEAYLGT
jgi:branched-chain amino acid transport system ATP-binding protein